MYFYWGPLNYTCPQHTAADLEELHKRLTVTALTTLLLRGIGKALISAYSSTYFSYQTNPMMTSSHKSFIVTNNLSTSMISVEITIMTTY